ncbi:MAG: hypothetical protein U0228_34810 [Myxococcaceae bacterium]
MTALAHERPWWIDRVRASAYRLATPWLGGLWANRDRRVAWMGLVSVTFSFALTVIAPMWLLALGPVLLGVPHLVADARYLVAQPKLHERGPLAWVAVLPLLATGFGAPPVVSLLVLACAVALARASVTKRIFGAVAWLGLSALSLGWPTEFLFAFLHLHNVVAIAWWWALHGRRTRLSWAVPALVAVGTLAILSGALDPLINWSTPATATSLPDFIASNAPFVATPMGTRLVLSFAFLQSVHYAMWLRLVPEDARARPAPRPFRETWRALVADFGAPMLAAFTLIALAITAWGAVDLAQARLGYLNLAAFHGYLELGAGLLFVLEARKRW